MGLQRSARRAADRRRRAKLNARVPRRLWRTGIAERCTLSRAQGESMDLRSYAPARAAAGRRDTCDGLGRAFTPSPCSSWARVRLDARTRTVAGRHASVTTRSRDRRRAPSRHTLRHSRRGARTTRGGASGLTRTPRSRRPRRRSPSPPMARACAANRGNSRDESPGQSRPSIPALAFRVAVFDCHGSLLRVAIVMVKIDPSGVMSPAAPAGYGARPALATGLATCSRNDGVSPERGS